MVAKFSLNSLIENLIYPVSGADVINQMGSYGLPDDFCRELNQIMLNQHFNSRNELMQFLLENITSHMASVLGSVSVQDLFGQKKAA